MASRVRHCVECPRCLTRYLLGFSPYRNGSYLLPLAQDSFDQWTLYCSCRSPHYPSRWGGDEVKQYHVAKPAHFRGFGGPDEITPCAGSGDIYPCLPQRGKKAIAAPAAIGSGKNGPWLF